MVKNRQREQDWYEQNNESSKPRAHRLPSARHVQEFVETPEALIVVLSPGSVPRRGEEKVESTGMTSLT